MTGCTRERGANNAAIKLTDVTGDNIRRVQGTMNYDERTVALKQKYYTLRRLNSTTIETDCRRDVKVNNVEMKANEVAEGSVRRARHNSEHL